MFNTINPIIAAFNTLQISLEGLPARDLTVQVLSEKASLTGSPVILSGEDCLVEALVQERYDKILRGRGYLNYDETERSEVRSRTKAEIGQKRLEPMLLELTPGELIQVLRGALAIFDKAQEDVNYLRMPPEMSPYPWSKKRDDDPNGGIRGCH